MQDETESGVPSFDSVVPPSHHDDDNSETGAFEERPFVFEKATPEDMARASRLIYYGVVLPKGTAPEGGAYDKMDPNDFCPEMTADLHMDDTKMLRNHDENHPIGKVFSSCMFGDEKHLSGYVDMKDVAGVLTGLEIMNGEQLYLSMFHDYRAVSRKEGGKGVVEIRFLKEVSPVSEGARGPNCKILYAVLDSTLERQKANPSSRPESSMAPLGPAAAATQQPPPPSSVPTPASASVPASASASSSVPSPMDTSGQTPPPPLAQGQGQGQGQPPPQQQAPPQDEGGAGSPELTPEQLGELDKAQLVQLFAAQFQANQQMKKVLEERATKEREAKASEYTKNMEDLVAASKKAGIGGDELRDAFKDLVPEGDSLDHLIGAGKALAVVTAQMANAATQIEEHRRAREEADKFRQQAVEGKGVMQRSKMFDQMLSSVAAPSGNSGLGFPSRFEEPASSSSSSSAPSSSSSSAPSQAADPQDGSGDLPSQPRKRSRTENVDAIFQATFRSVSGGHSAAMANDPRLLN